MDILPPTTPETIAEKSLSDVVRELDQLVDKTPLKPIIVTDKQHAEQIAIQLLNEKALKTTVLVKMDRFADFSNRIHKAITGKRGEYTAALDQRIGILDAASVEWDDRAAKEAAEEADRLAAVQAKQDEERRKEEAKSLLKQGKNKEAKEVLNAPARSLRAVAPSQAVTGLAGFGFKEKFTAECENVDALLYAIARPEIYREVADVIRTKFKKQGKAVAYAMADLIEVMAGRMPQIPSNVFASTKSAEKDLDTKLTAYANQLDGKMDWPGCVVSKDKKTSTRAR